MTGTPLTEMGQRLRKAYEDGDNEAVYQLWYQGGMRVEVEGELSHAEDQHIVEVAPELAQLAISLGRLVNPGSD